MTVGRYLDPPPTFSNEQNRSVLRQHLRELKQYYTVLDRIIRKRCGYRTDGYWWALTRRARIEDEIKSIKQRLYDLKNPTKQKHKRVV